ncbi:MAG TPA: hypothetical protein VK083_21255 [Nocardia sp.]|uniref:hypothetical protein n=1 Tax=Nocardia TaxID=1817 RepID=UPI0024541334|nr:MULTISPECIES: hypothetical protein [Nocardia]HLS79317.1 hypothetical protein [Nocardia sp.]
MVERDIPGAPASTATPASTPALRAADRLRRVLPPGYEVRVDDAPADPALHPLPMRGSEPVIRVLVTADRAGE